VDVLVVRFDALGPAPGVPFYTVGQLISK
jgi:hypothetical protein